MSGGAGLHHRVREAHPITVASNVAVWLHDDDHDSFAGAGVARHGDTGDLINDDHDRGGSDHDDPEFYDDLELRDDHHRGAGHEPDRVHHHRHTDAGGYRVSDPGDTSDRRHDSYHCDAARRWDLWAGFGGTVGDGAGRRWRR